MRGPIIACVIALVILFWWALFTRTLLTFACFALLIVFEVIVFLVIPYSINLVLKWFARRRAARDFPTAELLN